MGVKMTKHSSSEIAHNFNGQGVHALSHVILNSIIHKTMAFHSGYASKGRFVNLDSEVGACQRA